MRCGLVPILLPLLLAVGAATAAPQALLPEGRPDIVVYVQDGCPHCAEAKAFLAGLVERRPDLSIELRNVSRSRAAVDSLHRLASERGMQVVGVPLFVIGDEIVMGFDSAETTGTEVETLALRTRPDRLAGGSDMERLDTIRLPLIGTIDVGAVGLPLFTIAIGLLDGFNPCAMWVLLFLLSILVRLRSRRKMFVVGGIFVLVSGVVYFAFMAAWLNAFVLIGYSRTIQLVLGGVAIAIGALNVKDFFWLGSGPSVGIPARAKPGIYVRARRILTAERIGPALGGVIVLAFLVNTVELLCTAGLPALYTQILSLRDLAWWQYYGYLALYNLFYMIDDSLILVVAVVTLSHHRLQRGEARWLKLVSGGTMVALGLVLVVRPGWLVV